MRSRKLAIGFGLFLLAGAATSAPAFAESPAAHPYPAACMPSNVSQSKSDEAHSFYNAGRALYDEGNYDGAIAQFREAYKRDCSKHELLVIISRAYELKGDRAEAVRALETFLERVKDSPEAGTHRTKIENLKKQIAAQPPPPPPPPPTVAPPPVVREHTILPWIVVGLGGAAAVAGVIVVALTPKLPENCPVAQETCLPDPTGKETPSEYQDRQARAGASQGQPTIGALVIGGGLVFVAGGLLWHFLEPTGPVTAGASLKPRLTPSVAPGYAGMSLGATF